MFETVHRCGDIRIHGACGKDGVPEVEVNEGAIHVLVTHTGALQKVLRFVARDHARAHRAKEPCRWSTTRRPMCSPTGLAAPAARSTRPCMTPAAS
jgi:hypothetical protein